MADESARAAAAKFLARMEPYIWRRNLDYWAIGDIQAIKRMINTKVGASDSDVRSPDVKLGRGKRNHPKVFLDVVEHLRVVYEGRQQDAMLHRIG